MLRLATVLLLLGAVAEASRCKYRELQRPPPLDIVRPRLCRGAGSFIGDDYWTSIGYDGQIRDGRSRGDFLIFDQINNGYIAYWITRTKYGNIHYEAFGHAFVRPDGKICAWFVGKEKEIVEVCGGFRILSRNRFNPAEPIPFEWVLSSPVTQPRDSLGFHKHRIAKFSWEGENFYGDARIQDRNFQGVSPTSENFVEVTEPFDFERKVWLLRRKPDITTGQPEPLRREPPPPPERTEFRYADPHTQEDILYQLPLNQRNRPGTLVDSRDPRYYDPRYWNDRRNWKWVNGQWIYEPGNFENSENDSENRQDPRFQEQRAERPRFYQNNNPRFVNNTVDTWKQGDTPSQQDRQSVPGYPYPDGLPQAATRVSGDNDGWHVVGDSQGTPVGEGAAPAENRVGGGVHPQGQQPHQGGQTGSAVPQGADVQDGYYTDHYGRRIPVDRQSGRPAVGEGAVPGGSSGIGQGVAPDGSRIGQGVHPQGGEQQVSSGGAPQAGVPLNQQEVMSFPNSPNVGQGTLPASHMARMHRRTMVKDEFGTIYLPKMINGEIHYIPQSSSDQIVRPDPRLVSNPRIANAESEQWRRQQEHMRIAEEERRLQEQAVRDRWDNEQANKNQKKEEKDKKIPQWKEVGRKDGEKPVEAEREEPVPFEEEEQEENEEEPLPQLEKLPAARENPEEAAEDDEDDV